MKTHQKTDIYTIIQKFYPVFSVVGLCPEIDESEEFGIFPLSELVTCPWLTFAKHPLSVKKKG